MKLSSTLVFGAALTLAHANPVAKRAISDADILNYALTLEHLEATFYEEGLKNYTEQDFIDAGLDSTFYTNLKTIAMDETTHEAFLTQALAAAGAKPVERCTYVFPSTDVLSFLALGNVLEGVGVSAYLGAAASIMNPAYLTAAGSILTVEARHSAYLRATLGEAPSAQAFDNPLDFNEVFTVASPFIASCPSTNEQLPVKAFPSLTMSATAPAMNGSQVAVMAGPGFNTSMDMSNVFAAFITVTGPVWAPLNSSGDGKFTVTIPSGVSGQSYVVLTQGNTQATDDNILAGPAIIEVGAMTGSMGMGAVTSSSMSGKPTSTISMSLTSSKTTSSMTAGATTSPAFNEASVLMGTGTTGVLGAFIAAAAFVMQ
ncbi:uncharacterized protein N7482_008749 [Penicillium canariense]|uniref:Uncharacterized protein n=1 Tax=Penicillium canariense TaxID=189055 RepID=A0A9W9LIM8_9EURO|nr:uncharacterized protein N7482_008749 [Penicillium canariense]KAJ5157649.1 hypothetical protein N7482_008749 [Penicillium canariense]